MTHRLPGHPGQPVRRRSLSVDLMAVGRCCPGCSQGLACGTEPFGPREHGYQRGGVLPAVAAGLEVRDEVGDRVNGFGQNASIRVRRASARRPRGGGRQLRTTAITRLPGHPLGRELGGLRGHQCHGAIIPGGCDSVPDVPALAPGPGRRRPRDDRRRCAATEIRRSGESARHGDKDPHRQHQDADGHHADEREAVERDGQHPRDNTRPTVRAAAR